MEEAGQNCRTEEFYSFGDARSYDIYTQDMFDAAPK